MHIVVAAEGPVAIGALSRARSQSFFNTVLAENVTTGLDSSVFEVSTAHSAKRQSLQSVSFPGYMRIKYQKMTYS